MAGFPAEAIQRAVYKLLSEDAGVLALVPPPNERAPPRIYDEVPPGVVFPYIVLGDDQLIDDSACGAAWEVVSTIHVFSRPSDASVKGKRQAKQIADAVVAALGPATLDLNGFVHQTSADFETNFRDGRVFYEPDRLTAHAVIVFGFLIDQAAED